MAGRWVGEGINQAPPSGKRELTSVIIPTSGLIRADRGAYHDQAIRILFVLVCMVFPQLAVLGRALVSNADFSIDPPGKKQLKNFETHLTYLSSTQYIRLSDGDEASARPPIVSVKRPHFIELS